MEFIIITGMSGAGKSAAINALEDIGFFCVDNMPPQLIEKFVQISENSGDIRKIAFGCDVRSGELFSHLKDAVFALKQASVKCKTLFMTSADEVIKRRYKETRRKHPLYDANGGDIDAAIRAERELLMPICEIADYTLDTAQLSTAGLKEAVLDLVMDKISDSMLVKVMSFGFKHGVPSDADLVFDVRFLANPFYVSELKNKTGLDKQVRDFVMGNADAVRFRDKLDDLIDFLLPRYVAEGKSQLVIAFGCTGGKHRSVTFAEQLSARLESTGFRANVFHRDLGV